MPHTGLTILGHMALDGVVRGNHFMRAGEIEVEAAGQRFVLPLEREPVCRSKPLAVIPGDLWRRAVDVKAGGGGPNSARAAALMDYRSIQYLESCLPEKLLERALAYPHVAVQNLGLRAAPCNLVLEAGLDRLICRS